MAVSQGGIFTMECISLGCFAIVEHIHREGIARASLNSFRLSEQSLLSPLSQVFETSVPAVTANVQEIELADPYLVIM
jgi:hypothetical protein